jgi:hypothetical protein
VGDAVRTTIQVQDMGSGDQFGSPLYGYSYNVILTVRGQRVVLSAEAEPGSQVFTGYVEAGAEGSVGAGGGTAPQPATARLDRRRDIIEVTAALKAIQQFVPLHRGDLISGATVATQRVAEPEYPVFGAPVARMSPTADTAASTTGVQYRVGSKGCTQKG